MKKLIAVSLMFLVTGCSTVQSWIPSFWDDNQSHYITVVQLAVSKLNCAESQAPQVARVSDDLKMFELYSQSKGTLQKDVLRVIEPMQSTIKEWQTRGEASKTYCELKKKLLTQQGDRAARVILGRW